MLCHGNARKFGFWLVMTIGIAVASMSSGRPRKDGRSGAVPSVVPGTVIEDAAPHVSVVLPLLAMM